MRPHLVRSGRLTRGWLVAGAALFAVSLPASSAHGADRVYWANFNAPAGISFANLDGTGSGGNLNTTGATVNQPQGVAIDAARNRVYWANSSGTTISVANLDGSGNGSDLNTTGATVDFPRGVAIDPARNRIYWANDNANRISVANLDGTGDGSDLNTTGATVDEPVGVAIDPARNRIYWGNKGIDKVSFANLDGTGGGGDLNTAGASVSAIRGVAIDAAAGRIYWANAGAQKISFANLDGSGGGGDLNTTGATVSGPSGVAVDAPHNRIYWANNNSTKISAANLDGTGNGSDLNITGATASAPNFVALLRAPAPAGAPQVSGGSAVGTALSCSAGVWEGDLLGAFLSRAPQALSYSWQRGATDIPGAAAASLTPTQPGSYTCSVAAANPAGAVAQGSAAVQVAAATNPPPDVDGDGRPDATDRCPSIAATTTSGCPALRSPSVKGPKRRRLGTGRLKLTVACNQPCRITATGRIGTFALRSAAGSGSAKRVTLTLTLAKTRLAKLRRSLRAKRSVAAKLKVTATTPDGTKSTSLTIKITK